TGVQTCALPISFGFGIEAESLVNLAEAFGREEHAVLILALGQTVSVDLSIADHEFDVAERFFLVPTLLAKLFDVAIAQFDQCAAAANATRMTVPALGDGQRMKRSCHGRLIAMRAGGVSRRAAGLRA